MSHPIIFLDIDGPMIPLRAYHLPGQTELVSKFDPCAVSLVNLLLTEANAKIVVSSTWADDGLESCQEIFAKNKIAPTLFHEDWMTPRKLSSSRTVEIKWWLDDHPEVITWVAFDDEQLDSTILPYFVQCDTYEGLSYRNYLEARQHLGILTNEEGKTLHWLRKKEIFRTQRVGDPLEYYTWEVADKMFP